MTNLTYLYPTNITNITGFFTYVNSVSGGYFGTVIPFALFIITFIALKQYETQDALVVSSFLAALTSYLLLVLGLVNKSIPIMFTVILAAVLFIGGAKIFRRGVD